MAQQARPTATERFHPVNSRLCSLKRIQRLSDAQLEFYLASAVFAVAATQNSDETYEQWSGGRHPYKRVNLLREWMRLKQQQLVRERDRRINYHRRALNGKQAKTEIPRSDFKFSECPKAFTWTLDEAAQLSGGVQPERDDGATAVE